MAGLAACAPADMREMHPANTSAFYQLKALPAALAGTGSFSCMNSAHAWKSIPLTMAGCITTYRPYKFKEPAYMAKKISKTKETVILIRIPDMETRQGAGTLTIQRGDLGHIMQFIYTGLTVRGNIAEALKTAL